MYSDREVVNDPLDYVHSSLSQGNKVIYYQKECYRRTLSCPASASSSITNLNSCGKPEGLATNISASSSRSHSSNSVDSGAKQSRALVSDDWEQEDNDEIFEDVTKPSPGAKKFVAALSDVVLDDEATGRFPPLIEAETAQPDGKTQWLDTDPLESDRHLGSTDANMAENEAPVLHSTDANPPGNKTQWLDTEDSKPLWNKAQWQGAVRSESMENGPRWSDSVTYKPPNKLQWQNVAKREIETWLTSSSPGEPGNKAQWRDADGDKTKDRNEVDATTAKPKKQYSSKQSTTKSNECFSSEPILMKLPKGKLVMTRLSVVEKLSLHYIEDGHVKVLSNVREPDHCYLFIPDIKDYPEVLENLLENSSLMAVPRAVQPLGLEMTWHSADRITYSRNQLMSIKLFGNGPNTVPDLPASLKKQIVHK